MNHFSIVTPVYNQVEYIKDTVSSVINQSGNFTIEHIIVDGHSTDGTTQLLRSLPKRGRNWVIRVYQRPKKGMYDAIDFGFSRSTGNVLAWINADDFYLDGAFKTVDTIFTSIPYARWLKGITNYQQDRNRIKNGSFFSYNQRFISKGFYGRYWPFIQQDSVFWRRELWELAGPIDASLKLAGDYYLWTKFARHAPLLSFHQPVSVFRRHQGQQSENLKLYTQEMESVCPSHRLDHYLTKLLSLRPLTLALAQSFFPLHSLEVKLTPKPTLVKNTIDYHSYYETR